MAVGSGGGFDDDGSFDVDFDDDGRFDADGSFDDDDERFDVAGFEGEAAAFVDDSASLRRRLRPTRATARNNARAEQRSAPEAATAIASAGVSACFGNCSTEPVSS